MSQLITVDDLQVEIRRSTRRKTVDLTVDRAGELVISVPSSFSDEQVEKIIRDRMLWIYQTLGEKKRILHPKSEKEYVTGEGFFYLGKRYRLKVLRDWGPSKAPLRLKKGRFMISSDQTEKGREHFVQWYSKQAYKRIGLEIEGLAARVGVEPNEIRVLDLGNNWASCSKKGGLNFHWRVILLPIEKVRYLILHELVHLIEHNHSTRFYEILKRVSPDYEEEELWLKLNGDLYNL